MNLNHVTLESFMKWEEKGRGGGEERHLKNTSVYGVRRRRTQKVDEKDANIFLQSL